MTDRFDQLAALLVVVTVGIVASAGGAKGEEKPRPAKELLFPGETFLVKDSTAFVMLPEESRRQKPHGDVDVVVPLPENSAEFVRRYEAAGSNESIRLVIAEGQGHNFWEGFFRCQELVDFAIKQAREGADSRSHSNKK